MPAPAISLAHPAPASRNRGARREWRNAMKSAYGRQSLAPDYELTCVEPGSPMGELMRRYWQPVCTSDELRELPRKEKLLCEEIVVFRDQKGRVGALDPHCAHRGTSLEWGRVEEEGLLSRLALRYASASTCRARPRSSARRWRCG